MNSTSSIKGRQSYWIPVGYVFNRPILSQKLKREIEKVRLLKHSIRYNLVGRNSSEKKLYSIPEDIDSEAEFIFPQQLNAPMSFDQWLALKPSANTDAGRIQQVFHLSTRRENKMKEYRTQKSGLTASTVKK